MRVSFSISFSFSISISISVVTFLSHLRHFVTSQLRHSTSLCDEETEFARRGACFCPTECWGIKCDCSAQRAFCTDKLSAGILLCCRTGRNEGTPSWERGKNKIRQKSAFPPLPNGFSLGLPFPSPSPPLPIFRRRAPCRVFATAFNTPSDALHGSPFCFATSERLFGVLQAGAGFC